MIENEQKFYHFNFGSAVISQYRITLLLGSLEGHWATTRAAKKERNTVGISGFSLFHYNTQLLLAANSRTQEHRSKQILASSN